MATSNDDDKHIETKNWITRWCRRLKPEHIDWRAASEPTEKYNCMGFCMGPVKGKLRWWQPPVIIDNVNLSPTYYWPSGVTQDDTVDAFVDAAQTCRFAKCDSAEPEPSAEKITLFFTDNKDRPFWHAATHITRDKWISKLAEHSDIEHSPDAFDDAFLWGNGRLHMKRTIEVP